MGVCYRLAEQEDREDEALYRKRGAPLHTQTLFPWGTSTTPISANTAAHKQSRRFLECVDNNFLFQVTEEPRRGAAVVDLVLPTKEGLVENVKLKGSLNCKDHEMEFEGSKGGAQKAHYSGLQESRL